MVDKYHDPKGGLSAEGRKKFKKSDGSNLKPGVKNYDAASPADKRRWVSWAKRFAGNPSPLKKPNGDPTPYALMFQAWGRPIPKTAADVKATYDLAVKRGKTLENQKSAADLAAAREAAAAKPANRKLYDEVVAAAKKKFAVYPSYVANMWVVREYKSRGGKYQTASEVTVEPVEPPNTPTPEEETTVHTDPLREGVEPELGEPQSAKYYSKDERAAFAKSGVAMPDGKWPIPDETSLRDAIPWAKAPKERAHVMKRARALGKFNLIPATWKSPNESQAAYTSERVPTEAVVEATTAKAFVTEHAGRTLITGPATTIPGGFEKALNDNPHMLWLQGRLVGGETPNRNKALWTAGDLELGNTTVAHGPLNWLHEARHVIGAIAGSNFIPGKSAGEGYAQAAAESVDPHIVAAASVWRWLYPDEAMVVEQASELNQLWYSMECVADSVVCAGDDGCGTEISYVDYCTVETAGCEHIRQRSGVRRFANPTFLGAAVIVPPTRPGWADADARVMQQASLQAEKAFAQAGEPDITATDFEHIVAQVLRFAE